MHGAEGMNNAIQRKQPGIIDAGQLLHLGASAAGDGVTGRFDAAELFNIGYEEGQGQCVGAMC